VIKDGYSYVCVFVPLLKLLTY